MNRNTAVLLLVLLVITTLGAAQVQQYRADGPSGWVMFDDGYNSFGHVFVSTNWSLRGEQPSVWLDYSLSFYCDCFQLVGWGQLPASALTLSGDLNSADATLKLSVDASNKVFPDFQNQLCWKPPDGSWWCGPSGGGVINITWKKVNAWSTQTSGSSTSVSGAFHSAIAGTWEIKSADVPVIEVLGSSYSNPWFATVGVNRQTTVNVWVSSK